ncbi:MAG: asparaginase [Anaeroplasmataceae bacterium]|nr:asparaginase [Anaeroplasmataceae bacterium]
MQKILLLTTGGTISSTQSKDGLKPTNTTQMLKSILEDEETTIDCETIFILDSSNIQPEEWIVLANKLYENLKKYDGIIITHGTDTMSYTASMISFMIQNPNIPIVFTGSQLPIEHPLTDAVDNLRCAFAMAKSKTPGIFLAFNRKILFGCRSVKARTSSFDAFESINFKTFGRISATGLSLHKEMLKPVIEAPTINTKIETNIFLLKLTPTTNPNIIPLLISTGVKGIIIEAYGAGGISFIRRDFVKEIQNSIHKGIPIVVCSQCLYERANFNIYEVGTKVLASGAIEAFDMTTEATVTKLMYALGQTNNLAEIKKIFLTPISYEINPENYNN